MLDKGKGSKGASDCTDWRFGNCVANNGDCGSGVREGTCGDQTRKLKCKVPCNWKKEFGGEALKPHHVIYSTFIKYSDTFSFSLF